MRRQGINMCVLLLLLCSFHGMAQQSFRYRATLRPVDSTAFYRIVLGPKLLAKCRTGFPDLRLMDEKNHAVRYVDQAALTSPSFSILQFPKVTFPAADSNTLFVAENTGKFPVGTLRMTIKNTAVSRTFNVSGSDDLRTWFAIREDVPIRPEKSAGDQFEMQLSFPVVNYRYFRIQLNGKKLTPVNIVGVGIRTSARDGEAFLPLPVKKMTVTDSGKTSIVRIRLAEPYPSDKLSLDIREGDFYKRHVQVLAIDGRRTSVFADDEIASGKPQNLLFSAKATLIVIRIRNGDNPPLELNGVTLFQRERSVIARLEKGKKYHFIFGNNDVAAPEYDLLESLGETTLQFITTMHLAVEDNGQTPTAGKAEKKDYTILIWVAIAIVLGVVLSLTMKLVKEVNGKSS